ncbi:hypothetical protein [Streptococcus constellatus]|uniref:hypothetical protein n=1 Tax=Streptococcus constellatus TaxID=76860 RepID=UPI000A85C045|nr:hypothetical protein [Streptococcus constellatus]
MKYYLYKNHLGGYYTLDFYEPDEECYCYECDDYDHFVGEFESMEDLMELLCCL